MDEQRIQQYVQLIQALLTCANGEEAAILKGNISLVDAGLLPVMGAYGQWLRSQGEDKAADWLDNFAQHLQSQILATAPSEDSDSWEAVSQQVVQLYQQGQYAAAMTLAERAVKLARKRWGNQHPNVATSLNNLAGLYESQGRYGEAEPLYLQALDINRIALPDNHPRLASALNNLAQLYESQGRYGEAEPLYLQALDINRIALPDNHPSLATDLNNLAGLYRSQGRYQEALAQFQASLESEQQRLRYIFSTSSDRERRDYLESNRETYYVFLTLVWQQFPDDPQAVGLALDAVLRRKALTTAALAAQSAAIHSGRYSEAVQSLFQQWKDAHEEIREQLFQVLPSLPNESSQQYQQRLKERRDEVNRLQQHAETLEKQLAQEIPELQLNQENINRQVIAHQLPEGSALVEFVRFKRYDFDAPKGEKWQEDRYLAFVVMAHQPERVKLVDLGDAEPLDTLITRFRSYFVSSEDDFALPPKDASVQKLNRLLQGFSLYLENFYEDFTEKYKEIQQLCQQLQDILCQPLIQALDSASHWFLAPDSTLNLLPFRILPLDTRRYLGDKYSISYLSAGRDLLRTDISNRPLNIRPATILADPDYNWDGKQSHPVSLPDPSQAIAISGLETTVATLSGFERAVGTDSFGRRVGELLGIQPYLDKEAVSYHLTDGDCPRILAVATHGFYKTAQKPYLELVRELLAVKTGSETQLFEQHPSLMNPRLLDAVDEVAQSFEDSIPPIAQKLRNVAPQIEAYIREHPPSRLDSEDAGDAMYRSGIALAGANIWNQGQPLAEGMKGVLFAQDVAGLDLWGNELSALIACQSGLGDVASGEGVFGLRRAFVVAGSKTLLMSLWSVPARATVYLMERFFHHLNAGLGRLEALGQAQGDVRTVTAGELRQSSLGREILQESQGTYEDGDCPLSSPRFWGAWVLQGDISPLAVELAESGS